jgi:hypothetical protein
MILLAREERKTLDFIINYDIKYRMGQAAGAEDDSWGYSTPRPLSCERIVFTK